MSPRATSFLASLGSECRTASPLLAAGEISPGEEAERDRKQGEQHSHGRDGVGGRKRGGPGCTVDPNGNRVGAAPAREPLADDEVVEGDGEDDRCRGDDRRGEKGQEDSRESGGGRGPEIGRGFLVLPSDREEPSADDHHAVFVLIHMQRTGAMALSWTMDKIGPICRGVEDCAAALNGIYGPDGKDLTVGDVPFKWEPARPISRMRVGYVKTEFDQQQDPERKAIYQQALDVLRSAGANLQPLELPKFSVAALRIILVAEAATAFDDITRDGRVNQLSGQEPNDWPNTFRSSRFIPAVEYIRAQRGRRLLMQEMDSLMSKWDVFVSPAPGSLSLLITNLTGHPAVCVPCGFPKGLPQSIMFTGGLYDEGAPLRVALAYERATPWHTMRPKMDWA